MVADKERSEHMAMTTDEAKSGEIDKIKSDLQELRDGLGKLLGHIGSGQCQVAPCGGYPTNRNSGILETSAFSTMNFSRSWDPCLTTRNCGREARRAWATTISDGALS
jgi:hypothetical protein